MNLKKTIITILREENNLNPLITRRVNMEKLDIEFNDALNSASDMYYRNYNVGTSLAQFRNTVLHMTIDSIHWELYSTMPEDSHWYDDVFHMLRKYFDDKIEERYNDLNNDLNNEDEGILADLQEKEITERCWKGYTQKGMKTMFGKRYPNCVKIKKK